MSTLQSNESPKLNRYFDPNYSQSLVENVIRPINQRYFKCKFVGFEQLPRRNNPDRPLIYVSNHSGMAFPWDGMMFTALMFDRGNFDFKHALRALSAPALSQSNLMNPYLIERFWEINGAVEARFKYFETMMDNQDSNLLIYPEGVPGIGKGFNRRYQLQRFATSFVRLAIKYKTDIIPFATVNGEYINPYVLSWPWLNKWSSKIGIPYIPVGFHTLLLIVLPWLFYYGLPARLTYVMGKRIRPYEMIQKPWDEVTDADIRQVRDQIKDIMQEELDQAVEIHGKKKYSTGKIWGNKLSEIFRLFYYSPAGWPMLFHEHHRLYLKSKGKPFSIKVSAGSWLRLLIKNPFAIAYYIPVLGWIPILIKGYWKHTISSDK
jgi:1-acyl-sn-glycerol-3-phosphate acyltransferase